MKEAQSERRSTEYHVTQISPWWRRKDQIVLTSKMAKSYRSELIICYHLLGIGTSVLEVCLSSPALHAYHTLKSKKRGNIRVTILESPLGLMGTGINGSHNQVQTNMNINDCHLLVTSFKLFKLSAISIVLPLLLWTSKICCLIAYSIDKWCILNW